MFKSTTQFHTHSLILTSFVLLLSACSTDYKPVKVSQCGAVVKHTTQILGKLAKSQSIMIKECKKLSDKQRGCAMQANNTGALLKCSKIK